MAGDWIKMRTDLHTHPKVVRIVSAACPQNVRSVSARCLIVGALHAMWSLFDAHSTDGKLMGYTHDALDNLVGVEGFAAAVESVGWLIVSDKCLEMPNFEAHNGKGAKRRAEDTAAKRVRRMSAECPQVKRTDCGPEKRREEKRRAAAEAEAASALPPAAAVASAGGEEEARSGQAVAGILLSHGIGEPALSELAASGIEPSFANAVCLKAKRAGKGPGVIVNELRTAAAAQKANAAASAAARSTRNAFAAVWGSMSHEARQRARNAYRELKPHMRHYTGGAIEDLGAFQAWVCEQARGEVAA